MQFCAKVSFASVLVTARNTDKVNTFICAIEPASCKLQPLCCHLGARDNAATCKG